MSLKYLVLRLKRTLSQLMELYTWCSDLLCKYEIYVILPYHQNYYMGQPTPGLTQGTLFRSVEVK